MDPSHSELPLSGDIEMKNPSTDIESLLAGDIPMLDASEVIALQSLSGDIAMDNPSTAIESLPAGDIPMLDASEVTTLQSQDTAESDGAGAAAAESNPGQPLPKGVKAVFRNSIAKLMNFDIKQPVSEGALKKERDDSAAAISNGKAEDVEDRSAASDAAAGASAAKAEKHAWLDFIATPIRDDIAPDTIQRILSLRYTNRFFYKQSEPYMDSLATQLVALVLNGREREAKALIEACPYLLERRATVTDPVGRVYENVTAYEAALYAGDTQMCEMMHAFFEKHTGDGEAIRLEQYSNVFPEGVHAVTEKQHTYEFTSLIQAIDDASPEDVEDQLVHKVTHTKLGEAINRFREDFVALSKREQHANLKHLLEAFRVYAENESIAAWESGSGTDKMRVFWCQVIGFVQLYLPECDKQAFHQGVCLVGTDKLRLTREYDSAAGRCLDVRFAGCGFTFAACDRVLGMWSVSPGWRDGAEHFKNLYQTKTSNLERLCDRRQARRNNA